MLTIYEARSGALAPQKGQPRITDQAVWIDLLDPTPEEEDKAEKALKFNVPTREEQQEIEVSSRLYQEDGAHFMTATLLYQPEQGEPRTTPVTFILAGQRLVTVRYAEPRAFSIYVARCNRSETDLNNGAAILIGLIEIIVDRLADFIERIQAEVEGLSHSIFEIKGGGATRQRRFDVLLRAIGRGGEITSKARESAPCPIYPPHNGRSSVQVGCPKRPQCQLQTRSLRRRAPATFHVLDVRRFQVRLKRASVGP
jgi:magnesium transporter